jgi:hypothetical protein
MPTISRFYGIEIRMFFNEKHGPHFHALYAEDELVVFIENGEIMEGHLPHRLRKQVELWRTLHRDELMENWKRAKQSLPFLRIEGLK